MNYTALQAQAYADYRKSRPFLERWLRQPIPVEKFSYACAYTMQFVAGKPNPSAYVVSAGDVFSRGYGADWIDIAIEAVLRLIASSLGYELSATELAVWRTIVRMVLQFLISAMLFAQKSVAYLSDGSFNNQVKTWAAEAGAGL
jgi:hypothetical protein